MSIVLIITQNLLDVNHLRTTVPRHATTYQIPLVTLPERDTLQ